MIVFSRTKCFGFCKTGERMCLDDKQSRGVRTGRRGDLETLEFSPNSNSTDSLGVDTIATTLLGTFSSSKVPQNRPQSIYFSTTSGRGACLQTLLVEAGAPWIPSKLILLHQLTTNRARFWCVVHVYKSANTLTV